MDKNYSTANPLLLSLLKKSKKNSPKPQEELTEAKADQQKFIDKFGQELFDLFGKSKDRLKNAGVSTDIIYHVKNTSVGDMKNLLYNLRAKVNKISSNSKQDLTKIPGKYNYLGSEKGYDVYEPLDVEASMALGVGSGWCTTGRYGHAGDLNFKPSLKNAKRHWDDYTEHEIRFFYFLQDGIAKYALALYPRTLIVNKIADNIFILETNFELYNQQDGIDYNAISKLPLKLIKEDIVIESIEVKSGIVLSKDNKTLIRVDKNITSLTIPNSVVYIRNNACEDCKKLKSVIIPDSVTMIGRCAFDGCSSLTSVTIPDSVSSISEFTFDNCTSLASVTIPDGVTLIGLYAFSGCSSLTSITIPDSVTSIGGNAFYNCSSLTSITIPDSVVSIGRNAFKNVNSNLIIKTNNQYMIDYCKIYNLKYEFLKESLVNESMNETIEKHDELNPALFDGEELKHDVKEAVQNIADEFMKNLEKDDIKAVLKDVVLIGSNVNYNYNSDSDLDIHLVLDSSSLECPPELADKLYGAYRSIFNKDYDITIKGIPAEIYVELDEVKANSNGIYSIKDGWIKKPEPSVVPEIDQEAFDNLFSEWEDRYFALIGDEDK